MAWGIEYSKQARKMLRKMPANEAKLIVSRLEALAQNPRAARQVKPLTGLPYFRLRVGDWRVVYGLDGDRLIVTVVRVGARGGVYQ